MDRLMAAKRLRICPRFIASERELMDVTIETWPWRQYAQSGTWPGPTEGGSKSRTSPTPMLRLTHAPVHAHAWKEGDGGGGACLRIFCAGIGPAGEVGSCGPRVGCSPAAAHPRRPDVIRQGSLAKNSGGATVHRCGIASHVASALCARRPRRAACDRVPERKSRIGADHRCTAQSASTSAALRIATLTAVKPRKAPALDITYLPSRTTAHPQPSQLPIW